jgi:Uma2 family endonuclease
MSGESTRSGPVKPQLVCGGGRRQRGSIGVLSGQPHIEDLVATERLRPLRRVEYDRLVELGFFDEDEKIELLDGVIVQMTPQGLEHAAAIEVLTHRLVLALATRARVRVQLPFAASDISEPEPDLAVVPLGDPRLSHPEQALLLIEVADSSLGKDRRVKARIYAAAGVPEYWLVDVAGRSIEVRTDPGDDTYRHVRVMRQGETIRLQAFPDVEIAVSDIVR